MLEGGVGERELSVERVEIDEGSEGGVVGRGVASGVEERGVASLERESEAPVREEGVGEREARLSDRSRVEEGEGPLDGRVEVG